MEERDAPGLHGITQGMLTESRKAQVVYAIVSDQNLGEAVEGVAVLGVVVLGAGVGEQRELHNG